jgi:hypothetical protein
MFGMSLGSEIEKNPERELAALARYSSSERMARLLNSKVASDSSRNEFSGRMPPPLEFTAAGSRSHC